MVLGKFWVVLVFILDQAWANYQFANYIIYRLQIFLIGGSLKYSIHPASHILQPIVDPPVKQCGHH